MQLASHIYACAAVQMPSTHVHMHTASIQFLCVLECCEYQMYITLSELMILSMHKCN